MSSFRLPLPVCIAAAVLAASAVFPEPARAYDNDTHFILNYMIAREVGYTRDQAQRIASACVQVDGSPYTEPEQRSSPVGPTARFIREQFHAFLPVTMSSVVSAAYAARAENVRELYRASASLGNPGIFLHAFQDSFAHDGYWSLDGHIRDWHRPDYLSNNPALSHNMAMESATVMRQWLKERMPRQYTRGQFAQNTLHGMTQALIDANPVPDVYTDYQIPSPNYARALRAARDWMRSYGTTEAIPGVIPYNFVQDANLFAIPQAGSNARRFALWAPLDVRITQEPNLAGIKVGDVRLTLDYQDRWPGRPMDNDGCLPLESHVLSHGMGGKIFPQVPLGTVRLVAAATDPEIAPYFTVKRYQDVDTQKAEVANFHIAWSFFSFSRRTEIRGGDYTFERIQAMVNIRSQYPRGEFIADIKYPYREGTMSLTLNWMQMGRKAMFSRLNWDGFACDGAVSYTYRPRPGSRDKGVSGNGRFKFELAKPKNSDVRVSFTVDGQDGKGNRYTHAATNIRLPRGSVPCGPSQVFFVR